jgi:HEAT repeat protein
MLPVMLALLALTPGSASPQTPLLRVEIRCEATNLRVGDPVPITFSVTNVGTTPFGYGTASPYRFGALNFELAAYDENGGRVVDPQVIGFPAGGIAGSVLSSPRVLRAGDVFEETVLLNEWGLLREPGRYTVRGTYRALGAKVDSDALTVMIGARSDDETDAYIAELQREWLAAGTKQDRDATVRRLAYTFDARALPMLIDALHGDADFAAGQAIVHYLPITRSNVDRIVTDFERRGLPPNGFFVLMGVGASEEQIKHVIARSLLEDRDPSWQTAASGATWYGDDRFMARLIAIAESPNEPARFQAIVAIANNRTDEGVVTLKQLIDAPDPALRTRVVDAIRNAYARRRAPDSTFLRPQGRLLLDTDFPDLVPPRRPPGFE